MYTIIEIQFDEETRESPIYCEGHEQHLGDAEDKAKKLEILADSLGLRDNVKYEVHEFDHQCHFCGRDFGVNR